MSDVSEKVKDKFPMALTPVFPFFDVEFADDTAVMCRANHVATEFLQVLQEVAREYGLELNNDKTVALAWTPSDKV